jgi:hypothetical protein
VRLEVVEELFVQEQMSMPLVAISAPSWLCMPLRKVVIWMLRNFLQQVLKLMQFQGTESRQHYKLLSKEDM